MQWSIFGIALESCVEKADFGKSFHARRCRLDAADDLKLKSRETNHVEIIRSFFVIQEAISLYMPLIPLYESVFSLRLMYRDLRISLHLLLPVAPNRFF